MASRGRRTLRQYEGERREMGGEDRREVRVERKGVKNDLRFDVNESSRLASQNFRLGLDLGKISELFYGSEPARAKAQQKN